MKIHAKLALLGIALVAAVLSGCTAVQTRVIEDGTTDAGHPGQSPRDGIVYRLPLQAMSVTLTIDKDGGKTVAVAPTAAYADTEYSFVAMYKRSQFTTNTLAFSVDAQGLLTGKMKAKVEPLIDAILADLEKVNSNKFQVAGQLRPTCKTAGVYSYIVRMDESGHWDPVVIAQMQEHCGLVFRTPELLTALGAAERDDNGGSNASEQQDAQGTLACPAKSPFDTVIEENRKHSSEANGATGTTRPDKTRSAGTLKKGRTSVPPGAYGGIFYRQAQPYRVQTCIDGITQQSLVVMVTKDSPIEFLPFQKSLFATNEINLNLGFSRDTCKNAPQNTETLADS